MNAQMLKSLIVNFNTVAPIILVLELARMIWLPGLGTGILPRFPLPTGISWLWTYRNDYYRTAKKWLASLESSSEMQLRVARLYTYDLKEFNTDTRNLMAA